MNTDRDIMQQALEAMGTVGADWICEASHHAKKDQHKFGEPCPLQQRWHTAYQALRERLAQPEQEPVAWRNAAIRVGEDLCSVGPFGYYDMTAEQWLDWALSVVTVHTPPPAQQQESKLPEFYARFEDGLVSVYQRREDATPLLLLRENLPGKQPAQQQEPYGYFQFDLRLDAWVQNRDSNKGVAFYTTPPQRKPLTHPQIHELDWPDGVSFEDILLFVRAIEQAHGIGEKPDAA